MKYLPIIILVVVVLAVGYYFIIHRSSSNSDNITPTDTSATTTTSTVQNASGHQGLSYTAAVDAFTNRRIQFDKNCVMIPISMSLKNGTNVMFDNRSPAARTFALDGNRSSLAGYDFEILTLRTSNPPHTITVDCGTGRNNGKIILN
jgi:hypothetical protein